MRFRPLFGTKKRKVLFTGGTLEPRQRKFFELRNYEIIVKPPTISETELIEALSGVEAYIPAGEDKATRKVIQASSDLKIISFFGAGYEMYVDEKAATEAGIAVTNTPGANAQGTAEYAFGLIMSMVRRIPYLNETTRKGEWREDRAWNLKNRTLGIIGVGNIGSRVAKIARGGFSMRVIYTSRTRKEDLEKSLGLIWMDKVDNLLMEADIVTLHPPYNDQTKGLIGKKELELMKPTSILINAARPPLVDPVALREALENDKIGGVAFDGYYTQPMPSPDNDKHGLAKFGSDKLLVTPHTAYLTDGSIITMTDMVFESIAAFFEGKKTIPYLVNPDYEKNAKDIT
jgi:phosphoglycerate dehydrogenase-like enzyme